MSLRALILATAILVGTTGVSIADKYADCATWGGPTAPAIAGCTAVIDEAADADEAALGRIGRAAANVRSGNIQDAIADLDIALETRSGDPLALNLRGIAYQNAGMLDLAIRDFDAALSAKPDYVDVIINRAAAVLNQGDSEAAIREIDRALEYRPESGNLGIPKLPDWTPGSTFAGMYADALRLEPDWAYAHAVRAQALEREERLDEALEDYGAALAMRPGYSTAERGVTRLRTAVSMRAAAARVDAATAEVAEIRQFLYEGRLAEARAVAERALEAKPADETLAFALGGVRFLEAVQGLGQAMHRHGLSGVYGEATAMAGLPMLRLPIPPNPSPEELDYETLRNVLVAFQADLAAAEAILAGIGPGEADLPLDVGRIRLDLDGDGEGAEYESLGLVLAVVSGMDLGAPGDMPPLLVDFDRSDVPWLQGYCHLLMAISDLPLAYDWRPAFEATFGSVFPRPSSPTARLWERPDDYNFGGIADLVAFIHLLRWQLEDEERMRGVPQHLLSMVRLSRENWRLARAETDNAAEWIPAPGQTGAFPQFPVTEEQVAAWYAFLDELEAILQGDKRIPHWRFEDGMNLQRFFAEPPEVLDLVMLVHGADALPYLEPGEQTSGETWMGITSVFQGGFLRYVIWFN